MPASKRATDPRGYRRAYTWHESARAAFESYLRRFAVGSGRPVLLPAYIGWSPREGSGVFDPIRRLGLPFAFYRLNERLDVDLDHLEAQLRSARPSVLVLIHYFGRLDPGARAAANLAESLGVRVLEDEAHALLTDLVSGTSGRLGHAALFSLHKLLPVDNGGVLVLNEDEPAPDSTSDTRLAADLWAYDLAGIAARRVHNARRLRDILPFREGRLEPLWADWPDSSVPQSFPVLIRSVNRDVLYERANSEGVGVVSLYHTLIDEITEADFPAAHATSRHIMNLPVHQDVSDDDVDRVGRALDHWT